MNSIIKYLIILLCLLYFYSVYLYNRFRNSINYTETIPKWFDKSLLNEYDYKRKTEIRNILNNNKLYKYLYTLTDHIYILIFKLYNLYRNNRLIYYSSWNKIENIIDNTKISNNYDVVIGLKSGGAYISNYVAKINNIPNVGYIKVNKKSNNIENNISFFYTPINLKNKRILIVDDGLFSGKTFNKVKQFIVTKKPSKISLFLISGYKTTINKIKKQNKVYINKRKEYYYYGPWGLI